MKLSILLLVLISVGVTKDCLDIDGNPVDYWLIQKMPKLKYKTEGWEYLYCDAKNQCGKFIEKFGMDLGLNHVDSPLFRTIEQIKFGMPDEVSIVWNDQPNDRSPVSNKAHSKGLLTVSSKTNDGFVINHSLPNFPVFDASKKIMKKMPNTDPLYAQHFFCVSLGIKDIEALAQQYKIAEIIITEKYFPKTGFTAFPNLISLDNISPPKKKQGEVVIQSKGGLTMKVFSVQYGYMKDPPTTKPSTSTTGVPPPTVGAGAGTGAAAGGASGASGAGAGATTPKTTPSAPSSAGPAPTPTAADPLAKKRKIDEKMQVLKGHKKSAKKHKHHKQSFLSVFSKERLQVTPAAPTTTSTPTTATTATTSTTAPTPMDTSSSESYDSSEDENEIPIDFYADIVAIGLNTNIEMSTWGKGGPRLQCAVCNKNRSLSVLKRQVVTSFQTFKFSYTKEHSKFGISFGDFSKWVIIADLNRQVLKHNRGGTAICFQNSQLWKLLNEQFIKKQYCDEIH